MSSSDSFLCQFATRRGIGAGSTRGPAMDRWGQIQSAPTPHHRVPGPEILWLQAHSSRMIN